MAEYSDWEFMLNGDPHELRQFTSQIGSRYFHVYGGIDHWNDCPNEDFRMTTLYCQDIDDINTAWQTGHELVGLFNGASHLFSKEFWKLSIHRLLHKEKEIHYIAPTNQAALLGPAPFDQETINMEFKNGKAASHKIALIHLATENKDAYFILKYFQMPGDWSTYYKLMEAIESFAKEKSVDLKTNKAVQKSFTNTANNFSLAGFDSRHGFKDLVKLNKTPVMTIEQGHAFVSQMAKTYLGSVYFKNT
ncbi:hypothetical protein ABH309_05285 [Chromobacterium piscinae]|uniref:Uncharacterized protein n=1 Tax=Chromobacterium piscinae TaxID=686831 RepID=A0ABV0H248_9NEIS